MRLILVLKMRIHNKALALTTIYDVILLYLISSIVHHVRNNGDDDDNYDINLRRSRDCLHTWSVCPFVSFYVQ